MGKNRKYRDTVAQDRFLPNLKEFGQILMTFLLVVVGWIIFRADSIEQAWEYFSGIIHPSLFTLPHLYVGTKRTLVVIALMLTGDWLFRKQDHTLQFGKKCPSWVCSLTSVLLVLITLEFAAHSQSFIYFQF